MRLSLMQKEMVRQLVATGEMESGWFALNPGQRMPDRVRSYIKGRQTAQEQLAEAYWQREGAQRLSRLARYIRMRRHYTRRRVENGDEVQAQPLPDPEGWMAVL